MGDEEWCVTQRLGCLWPISSWCGWCTRPADSPCCVTSAKPPSDSLWERRTEEIIRGLKFRVKMNTLVTSSLDQELVQGLHQQHFSGWILTISWDKCHSDVCDVRECETSVPVLPGWAGRFPHRLHAFPPSIPDSDPDAPERQRPLLHSKTVPSDNTHTHTYSYVALMSRTPHQFPEHIWDSASYFISGCGGVGWCGVSNPAARHSDFLFLQEICWHMQSNQAPHDMLWGR